MRIVFRMFDTDENGDIELAEFQKIAEALSRKGNQVLGMRSDLRSLSRCGCFV